MEQQPCPMPSREMPRDFLKFFRILGFGQGVRAANSLTGSQSLGRPEGSYPVRRRGLTRSQTVRRPLTRPTTNRTSAITNST